MTVELLLFFVLALVAIGSALGMLLSKSAVYAALFLVLNFSTVAIFYILLNAPFIAMSQISVYAGAIMVLFLFVIMLLGTQSLPDSGALPWQRPLAVLLALVLASEAAYLLFIRRVATAGIPQPVETFGSPQAIGRALFNEYLLPFELTSVLLLVAMLGAIVLTKTRKGES
jgi:NADH-quinone oxidoreductase subunit J